MENADTTRAAKILCDLTRVNFFAFNPALSQSYDYGKGRDRVNF